MKLLLLFGTLLCFAAGCQTKQEDNKETVYLDVAPGKMEFIACGENGALAQIDMDGEIQTIKTGTKETLNGVWKKDGTLVAVGNQGKVFIQEDGESVEVPKAAKGKNLYDVGVFQENWIAVGDGGIWSSKDGKEWKQVQKVKGEMVSLACSDDLCICVRKDGMLYLSEDGKTWQELNFNEYYGKKMQMQQIIYGGGNFYLLGEEDGRQQIYLSAMGSVWSERALDMLEGKPADLSKETFIGMVWDGQEVVVGCKSGKMLTLPDCAQCNKLEKTKMKDLTGIAYCGGYYLLMDSQGDGQVLSQDDADTRQYKISVESAEQKTEAVFVDVRSKEEYEEGHITGSINLEVDHIAELPEYIPDKNQEIIFCCSRGIRSKTALEKALEMGYQNVFYMGKVKDWPAEGLSTGSNP